MVIPSSRWRLLAHRHPQGRIQVGEGLVQQAQLGLHDQGPGQSHPLLLAAADLVDVGPGIVGKAHHIQVPKAFLPGLAAADMLELQTVDHILQHGHMGEEAVGLEHGAHRPTLRWDGGDVLSVQEDLPAVRGEKATDHIQSSGLAAAGGAQDAQALPLGQGQRQVLHHGLLPEAFFQMGQLKIHDACLPSR